MQRIADPHVGTAPVLPKFLLAHAGVVDIADNECLRLTCSEPAREGVKLLISACVLAREGRTGSGPVEPDHVGHDLAAPGTPTILSIVERVLVLTSLTSPIYI